MLLWATDKSTCRRIACWGGGLPAMRQEVAAPTRTTYTLRDMRFIEVLAYETSGTSPIFLLAQGEAIEIFDPGPWTGASRGWRPGGRQRIDLAAVLVDLPVAQAAFGAVLGAAHLSGSKELAAAVVAAAGLAAPA